MPRKQIIRRIKIAAHKIRPTQLARPRQKIRLRPHRPTRRPHSLSKNARSISISPKSWTFGWNQRPISTIRTTCSKLAYGMAYPQAQSWRGFVTQPTALRPAPATADCGGYVALRPCTECKREISSEAKSCPHCGKQNPTTKHYSIGQGCAGCLVVVIVLAVIGALAGDPGGRLQPRGRHKRAQGAVR